MPDNNRSIGSAGLEQGGPNLGNDISRDDLSPRNAGDGLNKTPTMSSGDDDENTSNDLVEDDELEGDDDELTDDDELLDDLDEDDDEDNDETV